MKSGARRSPTAQSRDTTPAGSTDDDEIHSDSWATSVAVWRPSPSGQTFGNSRCARAGLDDVTRNSRAGRPAATHE
jgi:hypothetical protein